MDLSTILGIAIGVTAFIITLTLEHGDVRSFLNPSAFSIIFGGTIAATMISFPIKDFIKLPTFLKLCLKEQKLESANLIAVFVSFAEKARREGMLSLEDDIQDLENPFFRKALQLVVDGTDPQLVQNILETEIELIDRRHKVGFEVMMSLGGFSPTMGIIGTVMGLVTVLSSLGGGGGAEELGRGVAVAFIATFYGIMFANMFFIPLAQKLAARNKEELFAMEIIVEGVLAIQAGHNPRIVEQKLNAFFQASEAKSAEEASEEKEEIKK